VIFRVQATAEHVDKILAAPRPDILSRTLRFLREADCIIVVKINSVRSAGPWKTADWPRERDDTAITGNDRSGRHIGSHNNAHNACRNE